VYHRAGLGGFGAMLRFGAATIGRGFGGGLIACRAKSAGVFGT
jgi:hypothetical protein